MTLVGGVAGWGRELPVPSGVLARDAAALSTWHESSVGFLRRMACDSAEAALARADWRRHVWRAHAAFLRQHGGALFDTIATSGWSGSWGLGSSLSWLAATETELVEDARRSLSEKVGFEYKTAILLSELLAHPHYGQELINRARQPLLAASDVLTTFRKYDCVDLGGARITREGAIAFVEISSPDALNAEDDAVLGALEVCVDVALLDERVQVGVLRGAPVRNEKYARRRVFCSGINLFALYEGRLSYLYYVRRELGLVSKLYRGLSCTGVGADIEKPWLAAVDAHAIGGGCQLLLVMDYVLAERGAILSLPARREGILPGAANLRLARFVGERAARQALFTDRPLLGKSDATCPLVDEVVEPENMSSAICAAAEALMSPGLVSLVSHRKALRIAQEPEQAFRAYMSHFAIAQADCHFDPALIRNLERNWVGRAGHVRPVRSPAIERGDV